MLQCFVFYRFNVGHAENLSEMEQNCRLLWSVQSDSCELPVMAQSLWTPAAKMGSRGADALKLLGVGDKKKTKKKERDNQEFGWVLSIKNEEWTLSWKNGKGGIKRENDFEVFSNPPEIKWFWCTKYLINEWPSCAIVFLKHFDN